MSCSVGARGEMHAHAAGAPDGDDGVRHFEHEPGAILDFPAIPVCALVRAVLQELVEQIPVRAVDLDAVEPGRLRVLGAAPISLDDTPGISLVSSARGATYGRCGRSKLTLPLGAIALGATGSAPS